MNIHNSTNNTISMGNFTCKYCYRNYAKKENHDKHIQCCEFFNRIRREHDNDMDCYENLPSQREMYILVRELMFKCDKLEKEFTKMKTNTITKQRKLISDWLQQPKNTPVMNFIDWSRSIQVNQQHLDVVFQDDLTEGIKECIKTTYDENKHHIIPIRAFIQKPNVLYFYHNSDEKPTHYSWKIMTCDDVEKFISILSYKFLQEYMKFQRTVMDEIENDESVKEDHIIYMIKINGGKGSDERRRNEIKKLLYLKLQENMEENIELV